MSNARNIATATDVKPMFSAYQSIAQTLATATWTKAQIQTKDYDLTNDFDNVTNFRFNPKVAGYYRVTVANTSQSAGTTAASAVSIIASIWKNGVNIAQGSFSRDFSTASGSIGSQCTKDVYMNGSTDYIEFYQYTERTSCGSINGQYFTYFQAYYIANGV